MVGGGREKGGDEVVHSWSLYTKFGREKTLQISLWWRGGGRGGGLMFQLIITVEFCVKWNKGEGMSARNLFFEDNFNLFWSVKQKCFQVVWWNFFKNYAKNIIEFRCHTTYDKN